MANALTSLTHTILAQKALEAFILAAAPLRAFAANFSAEAAQRGDKVKVANVSAADAAVDFAGTYTVQDADMNGIDITLNKHKFVSWGLTDTELSKNPQVELERFARQKGFQLAKAVFQDILSIVLSANYGDNAIAAAAGDKLVSTAANFDADDVVDIRSACASSGWPEIERSLLLTPAYTASLLKDNAIQAAYASLTDRPLKEGQLPRLAGFDIFETALIPANGENLVGLAVHPDAILVAMRYLAPQGGHAYNQAEALTDPVTGLTIGFREWYDNTTGTMKRVLECVYGYQVGNATAIKRILSA